MTIHYPKHKRILLQILKDIYSDTTISPHLAFKGGTAAMMFYGLPRNSVDLDFDLLDENKKEEVFEKMGSIVKKYGEVPNAQMKRFSTIHVISHDRASQNIKVEVNVRQFGSQYEMKTLLGISMLVMVQEDMFAHKLVAMYERIGKTSRDVFDVRFFAKQNWPINKRIVEERTEMSFNEVLSACIEVLEKMNNRHMLDGLGELLTDAQKDSTRDTLKKDTIFLLKVLRDDES